MRSVIQFFAAKIESVAEIHHHLVSVYGPECMSIQMVRRWHTSISKGKGLLSNEILLVHDNAHPHSARVTQNSLESLQRKIFDRSSYSPDSAPSDFQVFPHFNEHLRGQCFETEMEVKQTVDAWLQNLGTQWFKEGFEKLFLCYRKCIY